MANRLMVVIPCYNEEEVLPETSKRLIEKMHSLMEKGLITEALQRRLSSVPPRT